MELVKEWKKSKVLQAWNKRSLKWKMQKTTRTHIQRNVVAKKRGERKEREGVTQLQPATA